VLIEGEGNEWIKYQHRKVADKNLYYFVNSHKASGSFTVSFSEIGKPSLWNPETGEIIPITSYRIYDHRLEMQLAFTSWESYFIVLEQGEVDQHNKILITRSANPLSEIPIKGNWDFQLVPTALNHQWSSQVIQDTVSLPVMSFKPVLIRFGNQLRWKINSIKPKEVFVI